MDPKFLKLTKLDDRIYSSFRETFEELNVKLLQADDLKSEEAKEVSRCRRCFILHRILNVELRMFVCCFQRWRPFCNQFEGLVEDFNYGTLLRLDCEKDYTEENTIFGKFTFSCMCRLKAELLLIKCKEDI